VTGLADAARAGDHQRVDAGQPAQHVLRRGLADDLVGRVVGAAAQEGAAERDRQALGLVDLVTASASGVDPDISVAAARLQVLRVARARSLDPAAVVALVDDHLIDKTFGFLGTDGVNVLRLNLALDRMAPAP